MCNLFISDLDGTLLGRDGQISSFTSESLNKLIGEGVNFTVASARGIESIRKLLEGVDIRLPVIEVNGAYITDMKTDEVMSINDISYIHKYELNYIFNINSLNPIVSSYDGNSKRIYYSSIRNKGVEWFIEDRLKNNDKRLTLSTNPLDLINDKVVCYNLIDRKEALTGLYELLKQNFKNSLAIYLMENIYTPGWYWLSIASKDATKAKAINKLKKLSYLTDSKVYAFGDEANDIEMIRESDVGIAVGNAKDELKKIANEVIGCNHEDSVVKYIIEKSTGVKELNFNLNYVK